MVRRKDICVRRSQLEVFIFEPGSLYEQPQESQRQECVLHVLQYHSRRKARMHAPYFPIPGDG